MRQACDSHIHLYSQRDERWAQTGAALRNSALADYRALQARLACERVVIVQPRLYGADNRFLIEMLDQLGPGQARGVAIVGADIADAELDRLCRAGIVGARFFVGSALFDGDSAGALATMRALDRRLHERGMHFQINTNGAFLEQQAHRFEGFTAGLVFDHLGHVLPALPGPGRYRGLQPLLQLMRDTGAWVKISGIYLDSQDPSGACEDMLPALAELAREFPDRVVWGSNWPHPTVLAGSRLPDDALLFEQVTRTLPHEACERMLVSNAAVLYRFTERT